MALDRQSIEKKDFPIGRRGYDPEAVDGHLHALADEIDELKRSARRRSESLAAAASEQVRSIVEAAETSAADIQRQAEDEAREIRAEATPRPTPPASTRPPRPATTSAGSPSRRRGCSSGSTRWRPSSTALIESLRTGSNRLNADLQLLEGNLTAVKNAVVPRPQFEPEQPPAAAATARRAPRGAAGERPAVFEGAAQVTGAAAGEVLTEPPPRPRQARG